MKLSYLVAACATCALMALVPAVASATVIELGATKSPIIAPTCPTNVAPSACTIVLTRVTAYETVRDGVVYPTRVKTAGRIVAFTIGLSRLFSNTTQATNAVHQLDTTYGGTTQVALTVLAPVGASKLLEWKVVAESPIFHVQPYLGEVVQFPLNASLPVSKGDVIGLTVPTWAPVLSIDLASKSFAYRQSRTANCAKPPGTTQAQVSISQTAKYSCNYPGTRAEYSATEITNPTHPKVYIH
jgi:hypothetical protein